jgi:hypothetical protein
MLKIKNPTDILGMNFVGGKYILREAEEHSDRYTFSFQDTDTNWAIIDIFRQPKWDAAEDRNMYRVDNGKFDNHWISAKYFGMIKNVKITFTEALKDL